jgi:hypothetical protein
MTARCLLEPGCKGTPTWTADAEKLGVPKRIAAHMDILKDGRQLSEDCGVELAKWAAGGTPKPRATGGDVVMPSSLPMPKESGGPTDEELVVEIGIWSKKKKFEMAYDLARSIKDEKVRDETKGRIDKAKAYVEQQTTETK